MATLTINVNETVVFDELVTGEIFGLTPAFIESAFQQEANEAFLVLLTLDHDSLSSPIRVVNNNENITSRSNTFLGFPFEIVLPDSKSDAPPRAQLVIDNTTTEIAAAIRSITSAPTVTLEIIMSSTPDIVERKYAAFKLRNVQWNINTLSGDLVLEFLDTEPFPALKFTPNYFPGLFY